MPVKVIDASAAAAMLFNEPDADIVVGEVDDYELVAPPLLVIELANVCVKKIRAHTKSRDLLLHSFGLVSKLDIEFMEVDIAQALLLAEKSRLTVYDACYLWLARELRCALVTLDRRLKAAAK